MSMLFRTQNIACAANLQIPHGNPEAGAKFRKFSDGLQPFLRDFFQDFIFRVHKIRICQPVRTADTSPQLIQLRESHRIGVGDQNRIGIGDIQPCLNDGRAD